MNFYKNVSLKISHVTGRRNKGYFAYEVVEIEKGFCCDLGSSVDFYDSFFNFVFTKRKSGKYYKGFKGFQISEKTYKKHYNSNK